MGLFDTLSRVVEALDQAPPSDAIAASGVRPSASATAPAPPLGNTNVAATTPAPATAAAATGLGFGGRLARSGGGRGDLGAALEELSALSHPRGGGRRPKAPSGWQPKAAPAPGREAAEDDAMARLLIRAMLQAAKSDGRIDREERGRVMERLGTPGRDEMEMLSAEMDRPLDLDGLLDAVPEGAEAQVYYVSLRAITLDSRAEADWLDRLARGLGLSPETVNRIHARAGVPGLYR